MTPSYCYLCVRKIINLDLALSTYQDICDHFVDYGFPLEIRNDHHLGHVIRILESKFFVVSTEINHQYISIKPLGYLYQENLATHEMMHTFCTGKCSSIAHELN